MNDDLVSALEGAAEAKPQGLAVVFGERRIAYAELVGHADRAAAVLWSLGLRPGDRVALLAGNRPEYLELLFGAAKLGVALVPMNTRYGAVDLRAAIRRCAAKYVFFAAPMRKQDFAAMLDEALSGRIPSRERPLDDFPELEGLIALDAGRTFGFEVYEQLLRQYGGHGFAALDPQARADSIGLMLFTSGSSGVPKPTMLGQRELVRNMRNVAARQGVMETDKVLSFLPYFHVFGGVISTLVTILSRGTILMMESFDATASLELVERERCTIVYSVGPCYQSWLEHPDFARYDLSSVRSGVCSASQGPMSMMAKRVRTTIAPMHSLFGMTETGGVATFTAQGDPEALATETAGFAMPGFEVAIFDPITDLPVAAGQEGELRLRGDLLARGYFRLPQETARAFGSDGWFRTGDRGWLGAEGYLRITGRLDDRLKCGGENVDPSEVEGFIKTLPGVLQCHVVGVPDPRLIEVPVAFIIPRDVNAPPNEAQIIAGCRGRIANFKIPRRVFLIEEAPGWMHKIQRFRLRQDAMERMALKDLSKNPDAVV